MTTFNWDEILKGFDDKEGGDKPDNQNQMYRALERKRDALRDETMKAQEQNVLRNVIEFSSGLDALLLNHLMKKDKKFVTEVKRYIVRFAIDRIEETDKAIQHTIDNAGSILESSGWKPGQEITETSVHILKDLQETAHQQTHDLVHEIVDYIDEKGELPESKLRELLKVLGGMINDLEEFVESKVLDGEQETDWECRLPRTRTSPKCVGRAEDIRASAYYAGDNEETMSASKLPNIFPAYTYTKNLTATDSDVTSFLEEWEKEFGEDK